MRAAWSPIAAALLLAAAAHADVRVQSFDLPSTPHDVAPAPDGTVWYTAQGAGKLGRLDPATGKVTQVPLGPDSAPHGVIIGPDGAAWVTDGGQNAIVRVDPGTNAVTRFKLPAERGYTNLNTAAFDKAGTLWFTGQNGIYGRLDVTLGKVEVFDAPKGRGPYGIAATPDGAVYYASLAGSHIARIDPATAQAVVLQPPTARQGARRVWSDSQGKVWVSEWNAGQLSCYDPASGAWKKWKLPGDAPQAYAVFVDDTDKIWVSDWGANAVLRFDPASERFESFPSERERAGIRQILGRPGEVWVAESGSDRLTVYRTR